MKSIKYLLLFLVIVSFSLNANSQLWKEYSDSAKSYSDQKKMDKAIEYYTKAKAELKKDSALTDSYTRTCNSLAMLHIVIGQYDKAEPYFFEAKQIREKIFGKEHPDYASSCNNLAMLYMNTGQFKKAEPLYLEAKQIREKAQGKEHPEYATSCGNLAILYMYMGQYEKAESLYLEAKLVREKVFGKEHFEYAKSNVNLAILYMYIGQYEKAESLYLESKIVIEKVFGKEHPDYAKFCDNLAGLYATIGQYKKAEPLWLTTKQIREKAFGKEHPDYAKACGNLAILYMNMGQYEKAEPLYLESESILEKTFGKEHPDYATSIDNLSNLYKNMGQYKKIEPLYLEAKRIREKILGKEHPDYATSVDNLANLYSNMMDYEKAEPLYLEARLIREKVQGKEHPNYSTSTDNLADLYIKLEQYEKAEPLLLEAKLAREKTLGKEHPDYAVSCGNLAIFYSKTVQYKKAGLLYLEANKIREKAFGVEHPDYILSCNDLANFYNITGQPDNAIFYYSKAIEAQNAQKEKLFQFTSEVEKQLYVGKTNHYQNSFFSFCSSTKPGQSRTLAYNASLSGRHLILSSSRQLRNFFYNSNDTSVRNKYDLWVSKKEQISYWSAKPIATRPDYTKVLDEQANTLEKELTRLSSAFRKNQEQNQITWKNIQQALKLNEAAIEFVEFNYYDGKRWTDSIYYIALLLRKDIQQPTLIRLFEKKQLDSLINKSESQVAANKINALYSRNQSPYNLVWKPLEKHLNGISKIYFAPAGNLFRISLAALPVNDKQVLSDKYQLIQLNTTATVADKSQSFITASDTIQLYGAVQYNADSAELKDAVKQYYEGSENSRSLPRDITPTGSWNYLPGTEREISEIENSGHQKKFTVHLSSGINATEESVKALNGKASPAVLHIATHGFFFPDPKENNNNNQDNFGNSGKVFKQSDNPLFRSGLIFAGANNAWQGKPIEGIEDGILTAYEVSNMYLPNTKLVVLSACETALGDIQGSEGVYGLQRAFKMAGVQNLVMSLWKIGDRETAEFMQLFYKNIFDKQPVSDAFYNAQTAMKNKYRNEPYKWAGWVLVR